jgi:O-antigen ligase
MNVATTARPGATTMKELTLGALVAIVCAGLVLAALLDYPLSPWPLALALVMYAGALWRHEGLWLAAMPAILAGVDFTPWTGWMLVTESDLFVLVTVGVLSVRDPPRLSGLFPHGPGRTVLAFAALALLVSAVIGYRAPPASGASSLVYLEPANALRVAKGFFVALLLLPFLRHRHTVENDAMKWFSAGMLVALTLVSVETLVERAVFPGPLDLFSQYPATGPFSSMHVGGGSLGIFIVMTFPFVLLRRERKRLIERSALRLLAMAASYALIVTFSALVYFSAIVAVVVTFLGRTTPASDSGRRRKGERGAFWYISRIFYVLALGIAAFVALAGASFLGRGADELVARFERREENLERLLSLRDHGLRADLVGMGLGAYPRYVVARAPESPSNVYARRDADGPFLSLTSGRAFFFGQKVILAAGPPYTVSLSLRSAQPGIVTDINLCDKHLLASENCRGLNFKTMTAGEWETFSAPIATDGLDPVAWLGVFHAPIDFALKNMNQRTVVDVRDVRLTGPDGRDVLVNGDFDRGVRRWFFTDENHDAWQIKNQYLMTLFEGGFLGLAGFFVLVGGALLGARRLMRRNDRMATAVVASLAAVLFLCLFEAPLQSPRVGAIFYLICFIGLLMLEEGTWRGYLVERRPFGINARVASGGFQPVGRRRWP